MHSTLNWFRAHPAEHRYKMKDLYPVAGISKQALHKYIKKEVHGVNTENKFFEQASAIRKDHPGSGCRKIAMQLSCCGWGRDKIERLLLQGGYRISYRPNFTKTTRRQKLIYYPNLIEDLELNDINTVVQTDITYYWIRGKFYYLTFLIDVYSRRIVGFAVSKGLEASGNIKALKMLFKTRKGHRLSAMIHHSDRGSQYIDKEYVKLLRDNSISMSMCDQAWQNAYAERINRTIKEEYLYKWKIDSYAQLCKGVTKAVNHYNHKRLHKSLQWRSPLQFEQDVQKLDDTDRPKMRIYKGLE